MPQDNVEGFRRLSNHILERNGGDFLLSDQFSHFCRKYEIYEIWSGLLASAMDRPDLYGDEITRSALGHLLEHIARERRAEFPGILREMLTFFAKKTCYPSYFFAVKQDLLNLGFTPDEAENSLPKAGS